MYAEPGTIVDGAFGRSVVPPQPVTKATAAVTTANLPLMGSGYPQTPRFNDRVAEERRTIGIRGEMIRLGQLLKLADIVDSGGEARDLLEYEDVLVNGERETRRGRQLHPGDVISLTDVVLEIVPIDTP
jgi:ribosome-associated protein